MQSRVFERLPLRQWNWLGRVASPHLENSFLVPLSNNLGWRDILSAAFQNQDPWPKFPSLTMSSGGVFLGLASARRRVSV